MAAAESTLISAAPATESASMEDSENQPMDQPHVAEATPTAALEELLEAGSGGEKKGKGGKKGGKKGKGKGGKKKKPKLSLAERRQSQTNQESSKTTVESEGLLNTSFDYAENQAKIERMEKDSKAFRKNLTEAKNVVANSGRFLAVPKRRETLKLEKQISNYMSKREEFNSFIDRLDHWRQKRVNELVSACRKMDLDGSGSLDYESVKPILVDLDIPCNTLELEIFCRLVDLGGDPDANGMHSGSVDYADFAEPLVSHLELLNPEPILTAFKPRSLNVFYHQSTMPRYLKLWLRFLLFENIPKCVNHISIETTDDVTLDFVASEVRRICRLPQHTIKFFQSLPLVSSESSSGDSASHLPLKYGISLCDLEMEGCEQKHEPEEYTLYYDYDVPNFHTSILDPALLMNSSGRVVNK